MALAKGKLCTRGVDVWELIPCGSILCVCVWGGVVCKSVWAPLVCLGLERAREGAGSPATGVTVDCELPGRC